MSPNWLLSIFLLSVCYVPDTVPNTKSKKTQKRMLRNKGAAIVSLFLCKEKEKIWQGCYTCHDTALGKLNWIFSSFCREVKRRNEKITGRIYIILGWQYMVPIKNWLPGFLVYSPSHSNSSLHMHSFPAPLAHLHSPLLHSPYIFCKDLICKFIYITDL